MTRSGLMMGVGVAVAAGALAIGAAGSPASVRAANQACGTFTGTAWQDLVKGTKGTHWTIHATGVGCAFAKLWAVKLAKPSYKGAPAGKIGGPAGWRCYSSIDVAGGTPGTCRKSVTVHFDWGYAGS